MKQSESSTGRSGEYFAAYVLETYGVEAHRVDTQYSDIWCRVGDDVRAVEVKSCSHPSAYGNNVRPTYRFNVKSKKHGWYCFVALDRRLVLFRSVEDITAAQCCTIRADEFTEENQRISIEKFLESC